jgi:hypothetical protein
MNYGRACRQQQQSDGAARQNDGTAVAVKTQDECQYADRNHDEQHLQVKMIVAELPGEGQQADKKGQCQAVQKAQARQGNGRLVQGAILFVAAVIHAGLP